MFMCARFIPLKRKSYPALSWFLRLEIIFQASIISQTAPASFPSFLLFLPGITPANLHFSWGLGYLGRDKGFLYGMCAYCAPNYIHIYSFFLFFNNGAKHDFCKMIFSLTKPLETILSNQSNPVKFE